jgi:hypothetical protein
MHWLGVGGAHPRENGLIAMTFAMIIAGGLMLGMLALTVDTGRLFVERRAVQNGADAAAIALAQDCALDSVSCAPGAPSIERAGTFADLNAADETSTVAEICGSTPFAACPDVSTHEWECRDSSEYGRFVRVRTATREADGATVIPPVFSDVLTPTDGTGLWACAQAAWGSVGFGLATVPFALSVCDYVESGTTVVMSFPNNASTRTCTITDANGDTHYYEEGLAGLSYFTREGTPFDCVTPVLVNVGDWLTRQTIASTQQVCGSPQPGDRLNALLGTDMPLPVVGNVATNGQGSYPFQVVSFVRFQFLGYWLQNQNTMGGTPPPGAGTASQRWQSAGCVPGVSCLYGTFVNAVSTDPILPGGLNTGAMAVQLIP